MKKFNDFFTYKQDKIREMENSRDSRKEEDIRIEKFLVTISNTLNRIQSENSSFTYERESDNFLELKSYTMNYKVFIEDSSGRTKYHLTFLLLNNPKDESMIVTLINPELDKGVESKGFYQESDEEKLETRLTEMFQSLYDVEVKEKYSFLNY